MKGKLMYNAPWLEYARQFLGVAEDESDSQHNPTILEYSLVLGIDWMTTDDDEHPWCAAFVGAALEMVGFKSTRKMNAKSYLDWGQDVPLNQAQIGDIAVFHRGSSPAAGHVGFIVGFEDGVIHLLGGNQGNQVSIAKYLIADLAGVRRPLPNLIVHPLPESEILPSAYNIFTQQTLPKHLGGDFAVPLTIIEQEPIPMTERNQPGTRSSAALPVQETTVAKPKREPNLLDIVLGFGVLGRQLTGRKTSLSVGGLVAYTIASAILSAFGVTIPAPISDAVYQGLTAYAGGAVVAKITPSLDALAGFVGRRLKDAT